MGQDGLCEGAPGGSSFDAGCPAAKSTRKQWEHDFGDAYEASLSHVPDCLKFADAGLASGELSFAMDIDPDGVVYSARIVKGALPEANLRHADCRDPESPRSRSFSF